MRTIFDSHKKKVPVVATDPTLDRYDKIVLFPQKLEKANKKIKLSGAPFSETKKEKQAQ
jgi:hypothetical protein